MTTILGEDAGATRQALRSDGLLCKTGLVVFDVQSIHGLDSQLDLLSDKLPRTWAERCLM